MSIVVVRARGPLGAAEGPSIGGQESGGCCCPVARVLIAATTVCVLKEFARNLVSSVQKIAGEPSRGRVTAAHFVFSRVPLDESEDVYFELEAGKNLL